MLIEFTVGNFRSFKEPVTFSMVAAKLNARDPQLNENNTFRLEDGLTLLSSAALYGANASGKSNLVKALRFMRRFVLNSSKESQVVEPINTVPFLLSSLTEHEPSYFEVVFYWEGITYRYGFEVTEEKVETEWLFYTPHAKEAKLFVREGSEITLSRSFKGGQVIKPLTRANALFLSVAAQFNNDIAAKIVDWFKSIGLLSALDDSKYGNFTATMFSKDSSYQSSILELIRESDVGINDVKVEEVDLNDPNAFPQDMPQKAKDMLLEELKQDKGKFVSFKAVHDKSCENDQIEKITFDMNDESEGTNKLFKLSGPIIDTLRRGSVLMIDEIEASKHTLLTRSLIRLFNSQKTNPKHAQLIFTTHDTNLLSNKLFRRDQIWFVEKDGDSASHLYSLVELKVRNDRDYEKDYLSGRYGGVPILGELRNFVLDPEQEDQHDEQ
jgi:AAA15 family ATPase/GTPase